MSLNALSGSLAGKYSNFLARELRNVFALDLRSLSITRIGIALIILCDIAIRIPDIGKFYGDSGVLPTNLWHTFWMGDWAWSIHSLFGGATPFIALLFFIQAFAACTLLIGYRTPASTLLSWILLVSLHNANPLILLGGDFLLRAVLFVGIFLPWGEYLSVDSLSKPSSRKNVISGWSAAFMIQISFMYYFASMFKNSIEWSGTGTALYYIASIDQYATPIAKYSLQFPDVLRFFTFAIYYFQHAALFLIFFPIGNIYIRLVIVPILMAMHFSFAVGSQLGIFSWVSISALIGFMPSIVWDKSIEIVQRWKSVTLKKCAELATPIESGQKSHAKSSFLAALVSTLGVVYISYVFAFQAEEFAPLSRALLSGFPLDVPAAILRIDQRWNLFAPRPYVNDGWDIVEGTLKDGRVVDLFRGGAPLTYEKPLDVYGIYGISHRRQYTLEFRRPNNERYRPYYGAYECRSWNFSHEGKDALVSLEAVFMEEVTPPPGEPQTPIRRLPLLHYVCPL